MTENNVNISEHPKYRMSSGGEPGRGGGKGPRLPPSGKGPYDPDMENRVALLEAMVPEIKTILGAMVPALDRIEARLAAGEASDKIIEQRLERIEVRISALPSGKDIGEISGKLSQLPNVWQLVIFGFAQVGMVAAIMKLLSP